MGKSKKNIQDYLYLILAFIPLINCMAFFHMYGHVPKKKYSVLAWFSLALNLVLVIGMILIPFIDNPNERPSYYEIAKPPQEVDFMNEEQHKMYKADSSFLYSDEFELSNEYKEYKTAYDQYQKDLREWEKTPEIAAKIEAYQSFNDAQEATGFVFIILYSVFNFIIIILVFAERPRYMAEYKKAQNKNLFAQRINNTSSTAYNPAANNYAANNFAANNFVANNTAANNFVANNSAAYNSAANNTFVNSVSAMEQTVDVNSAPEDEIAKIPGLTVIEAKRAVDYRTQNGGFKTKDEFFGVINAKPHIIARAEKYVIVGEISQAEPVAHNNVKRRIDL